MTNKLIGQGKKYLSNTRLFRYLNFDSPLELYFVNLFVSEKLFGMISIFEVIFRNKIHNLLIEQFGKDYLINQSPQIFNKTEKGIIKSAIKESKKAQLDIYESRILTEITLGFWCALATKHTLWIKCIHKIHPNRKLVKFKDFVKRIKLIITIRNKIAHHERLIKKRPYNINEILQTINNEILLLIDDADAEFKKYIENYLKFTSSEVKSVIRSIKKTRGH